jgi:hypothetical protein
MKLSPIQEKPPATWRFDTRNCIALDRLVEVALSPTGILDSSFRNNAKTPEIQVPSKLYSKTPKSAVSRDGSRDGEGEDDDASAAKRRHCSSNGIKLAKPAAPSPSPSPSSEAPNHHHSAGYFLQQQQQQQEQRQKLKRRLSSCSEVATPAGRSSSSLHVHPHAKRFKLTPRFKALVDISC